MKSSAARANQAGFEDNLELFGALQKDVHGFRKLREFLKHHTGIDLAENPASILKMANRLSRVLVRRRLASFSDYAALLVKGDDQVIEEFITAMTTKTTRFFREGAHFEILRRVLPSLLQPEVPEFRMWCAATSTGQEAYSLAMTLLDCRPQGSAVNLKLLATDVDRDALERAARGVYSEAQLKDVPKAMLSRHFIPVDDKYRRIGDHVRDIIRFAPFNLHSDPYPFKHRFDMVFCRNVLIYFSRPMAKGVIDRITDTLRPGGLLFVGHSEVGFIRTPRLKPLDHSVYQKVEEL